MQSTPFFQCAMKGATRSGARRARVLAASIGLGALAAVLLIAPASAAGNDLREAQARYKSDRAMCMNGSSNQDRATCLQEAGAALRAARQGQLSDTETKRIEANRSVRCDPLPAQDREDCMRRMSGEGITSGAARDGGTYRELTRPEAAPRRVN